MGTRIYVGNLPIDIRTREVEDLFYKYGRIRDIDIKQPSRPPAFAFVDFRDPLDAEDAVKGRDGYKFDGARLRVEFANGKRRGNDAIRDNNRRDGGRRDRDSGSATRRHTEFRVHVSGLPPSASWQDLKDYFREVGEVVFTNVDRQGGGVVEFAKEEDMQAAVDKLDDTEFKGRFDQAYIRVYLEGQKPSSRSRSRSPERDDRRSRSRSRSPAGKDQEENDKDQVCHEDRQGDRQVDGLESDKDDDVKEKEPEEDNIPPASEPVDDDENVDAENGKDEEPKDWGSYKVSELKEFLKERDLDTKGNKADLVKRLKQFEDEKN